MALVAAVFFLGPMAAGAFGVRAGQIENRALTEFPSLGQGWDMVDQLDQWAVDHLPLRDQAIQFNTDLSERLFGELPSYGNQGGTSDQVIPGDDDWMYLAEDISWMCSPQAAVPHILANTTRMADIAERTGARVIVVVPPDKATVETENLPGDYPDKDCSVPAKQSFWDTINANPPKDYLDLYSPIMDLRAREGEPIWRPKDSHWAPIAGAEYARVLANAIDPTLLDSAEVVSTGPTSAEGDLTRLLGTPAETRFEGYEVRRPGVTVPDWEPGTIGHMGIATYHAQTTDAPVYPGKVTIIGDSYTGISFPQITPYFGDLVSVNNTSAGKHIDDLATAMADSDVIVIETVERAYASGRVPLYDDEHLDQLDQAIGQVLAER